MCSALGRSGAPTLARPPPPQLPRPSITGEATKRLSIIVPAYNEEERLPATLDETLGCAARRPTSAGRSRAARPVCSGDCSARRRACAAAVPFRRRAQPPGHPPPRLRRYLQRRRDREGPAFTYEVIIVDDGSKDGTPRVALDYARRNGSDAVRLLRMPHNRRAGAGGMRRARRC